MNEKCYLCEKKADKYLKEKYFMGICNNCIVKIKNSAKKSQSEDNSINKRLKESHKKISQINYRIDNIISMLNSSATKPNANPTYEKPKKSISTDEKSSIKFRGDIRSLNDTEKRRKDQFQCPYCHLSIDPKLYFYPLVIHSCGNGYYHQKCFAKLMSEGEYHCLNCKGILFEKI